MQIQLADLNQKPKLQIKNKQEIPPSKKATINANLFTHVGQKTTATTDSSINAKRNRTFTFYGQKTKVDSTEMYKTSN